MRCPRHCALTLDAWHTITRHCEHAYPLEACGMLVGFKDGAVVEAVPTKNLSPLKRSSFALPMLSVFGVRAMLKRWTRGLRVIGFYHSHPNQVAEPSGHDRDRAWPGHLTVIVKVYRGAACHPRAWNLDGAKAVPVPVWVEQRTKETGR